ncbi:MAG TPA: hypothetical protein VFL86_18960, partial [Burkholderiaceae bacterium]|nr:hypothetical protein [Burkholderiaceae bacterium]
MRTFPECATQFQVPAQIDAQLLADAGRLATGQEVARIRAEMGALIRRTGFARPGRPAAAGAGAAGDALDRLGAGRRGCSAAAAPGSQRSERVDQP